MQEAVQQQPPATLNRPRAWRRWDVLVASFFVNVAALALPMAILQIYDRILSTQAMGTFALLIGGLVFFALVEGGLRYARSTILAWDGARYEHLQGQQLVEHILAVDMSSFSKQPVGAYMDRVEQLRLVRDFYTGHSVLLLVDLPFTLLFVSLIWLFAGPLVVVPLIVLAGFVSVSVFTGARLRKEIAGRTRLEDVKRNFLLETLQGGHTVKSMALEAQMLRRYERVQGTLSESIYHVTRINNLVQAMGASLSQIVMVSFVGIGAYFVVNGSLTVGALAAGTMLSGRLLQPALKALGLWTQIQAVQLAEGRLRETYSIPREQAQTPVIAKPVVGEFELQNVCYNPAGSSNPLFKGVDLKVKPGEAIGLYGENGSGKSTFLSLLMGYANADSGRILVDGEDLANWDKSALRAQIAYLPQRGVMFEGTILDNMTLFRDGEVVDRALDLSERLGLSQAILRMPAGLDTKVGGANSDTIPQGVRQMIFMVRAMVGSQRYGEPAVWLFDDANSCLDLGSNVNLMRMLAGVRGEKTMFVVSHKARLLELCDRTFQITDGGLTRMNKQQFRARALGDDVQETQRLA